MDRKTLIDKLKSATSLVDFYSYKEEIIRHLGGSKERETREKELRKLKMQELREIGKKLGAADTSKEELINEILDKEGY